MVEQELKYLVRIADTDLDGRKHLLYALTKIKGVSVMMANAVCALVGIDSNSQIGLLSDEQIKKISDCVEHPLEHGCPAWLVNRRWDRESGKNAHALGTELIIAVDNDIKRMKKIKCYKGVRHMMGQPVRGQRTRSNFRKNKGKVKLGVLTAGKKKGGTT